VCPWARLWKICYTEVGCGTAEFLCSLAAKEPSDNFVGVDVSSRSLYKAVEIAASLALENIRFIHADMARLYPLLEPLALRRVYVHFPGPNMRPKFRRRKIVTPLFLDLSTRPSCQGAASA
jgi:tRNA (guanine-N7-)-methyltransferase